MTVTLETRHMHLIRYVVYNNLRFISSTRLNLHKQNGNIALWLSRQNNVRQTPNILQSEQSENMTLNWRRVKRKCTNKLQSEQSENMTLKWRRFKRKCTNHHNPAKQRIQNVKSDKNKHFIWKFIVTIQL